MIGFFISVGLLWLRIDVIAVRKTLITTAIRTAFVILLFFDHLYKYRRKVHPVTRNDNE